MVYQLTDGDITKADAVWNTKTYQECFEFVCMKQFEALVEHRMMEQ